MRKTLLFLLLLSAAATAGHAETTAYGYDAFGRLMGTGRLEGPLDGLRDETVLDAADNRTNFLTRDVRLTLTGGQQIVSPDGRFRLVMQTDGNLVLYMGSTVLWATYTYGSGNRMVMQSAGNLVVYTPSNAVAWASSGVASPGAFLALQNDGNLAIYDVGNRVLWATNTYGH